MTRQSNDLIGNIIQPLLAIFSVDTVRVGDEKVELGLICPGDSSHVTPRGPTTNYFNPCLQLRNNNYRYWR